MNRIYLDWNATAPLLPAVSDEIGRTLQLHWGNASSVHHEGQTARSIVERARRAVAKAIGAEPQAVIFEGGATEANNHIMRHHARVVSEPFLVCTAVEHPSVLEVLRDLEQKGVRTEVWPVDKRGRLDLDWLAERAAEVTLVSVMLANNEIGNVYPVAKISAMLAEHDALLHVDATQAFGRIPVDFAALGADFLTLSFHKSGGPKGIGALVVREGQKVEGIVSGGHQERGRRPGTENVPAAAGLTTLARVVEAELAHWQPALEKNRTAFVDALGARVQMEVRGDQDHRLPNTVNVAFHGVDGEDLLLALDLAGIAASSGSACTAGSLEPSHVILAMGFPEADARRSVRFSFGPATPRETLLEAAERIAAVVQRLQDLGPDPR